MVNDIDAFNGIKNGKNIDGFASHNHIHCLYNLPICFATSPTIKICRAVYVGVSVSSGVHRVYLKMILFFFFGLFCSMMSFSIGHYNPHYKTNRSVIVHLFKWKFNDIADECEMFLAPNGFSGFQVSPVSENAVIENRPWWERYQPISYRIITRSGNELDFANMVERCNRADVRIYVDVILNHMTAKQGHAVGTGNATANAAKRLYPDVPYGPKDFHQSCSIHGESYTTNANEVRTCELASLPDLNRRFS